MLTSIFQIKANTYEKPTQEELGKLLGQVDTNHAIRPYLDEDEKYREILVNALNGLHSLYITIRYAIDGVDPKEPPFKDGEKNNKYFQVILMTLMGELKLTEDMAEALVDALQTNYNK